MSVHALNPQQFEQLPMFMSAHEIRSKYQPLEADHEEIEDYDEATDHYSSTRETSDELWDRKAEEADDWGLTDNIREHGVHTPIPLNVDNGQLANGHHRVAAMNDIDHHQLLPVLHVEDHELGRHGVYWKHGNDQSWD